MRERQDITGRIPKLAREERSTTSRIITLESVRHEFDPQRKKAIIARLTDVLKNKEKSALLNVDYDIEHPFNPDPIVKFERDLKTAKEQMPSTTKGGFAKREIDRLTKILKEIRFSFSDEGCKVFESDVYIALDEYIIFLQDLTSSAAIPKLKCDLSDSQLKDINTILVKNKMLEDSGLDLWLYWFNRKHLEKAKRLKWNKDPQLLSNTMQKICATLKKGAVMSAFGIKAPNARPERHDLYNDFYTCLDKIIQKQTF
jgi:hypothetical protein